MSKFPVHSMPKLDVPFKRVAEDIVGHVYPATEKEGASVHSNACRLRDWISGGTSIEGH